jgi:membrane protein DedA with SNARE-associated domain
MTAEATGFAQDIITFARENAVWIPPLVFVLGLAESLVVVSLFVPSTVLFLAIGAAHSAAGGAFLPLWLAGAVGAIIGDLASFAFGRHLKGDISRVWPFRQHPRALARGRLMFQRRGMMTIVVGKFPGNARPFLPIIAGAMRMPFPSFLIASVVSSLVWAGVFLAPGFGLTLFWPE